MADTLTVKLQAISNMSSVAQDASQVAKIIGDIKEALRDIDMPEELSNNFEKIFNDAEKSGKKISEALTSGFKNKSDVKKYEQGLNGVELALKNIVSNLGKVSPDALEKAFTFNIQDTGIKDLQKEVKDLQDSIKQLDADNLLTTTDALSNLQKVQAKPLKSWENFFNHLKGGEIDKLARDITYLEQGLKTLNKNNTSGTVTKEIATYQNGLNALKSVYDSLTNSSSKYNQTITQLNGKQEALRQELENLAKSGSDSYEDMSKAVLKLAQDFGLIKEGSVQSAEATKGLNDELEQFKSKVSYFFSAQNAVNLFKRAIRSAYEAVKDLDAVMAETAVVTDFSIGDMWSQLPEYTKRANELGVSIHDVYESATIYYQQGLKTNEVMALSNATLRMARIAGLESAEATDRMTNALRGFNMELNETNANRVSDVYSKLAAISASNVDEISTAMTKVASLASSANMQFETTSAFLAQIINITVTCNSNVA